MPATGTFSRAQPAKAVIFSNRRLDEEQSAESAGGICRQILPKRAESRPQVSDLTSGTAVALLQSMRRNISTLVLAMAVASAAGCDAGSLDADEVANRGAVDGDQRDLRDRGMHRRPHGPPEVVLVNAAFERGLVTDDEKGALVDAHQEVCDQHASVRDALLDAIAARMVPDTEAPLAALGVAATDEAMALTTALDDLHDRLTSEQRAELVAALPEPPPHEHRRARRQFKKRRHFAKELGLDLEQIAAVGEALDVSDAWRERPDGDAVLAFADDDFSAADLGLVDRMPGHVRAKAEHTVALVTAMLPVLDEDQKATLVELLTSPPRRRHR